MGTDSVAVMQRLLGLAPRSSMPAYDEETADNPDYAAWSAVRPSAPPALDYHGSAAEARDSVDSSRLTALQTPDQRQEFAEGGDPMVGLLRRKLGLGPNDRSSKQALETTQHTLEDDALTEQNKADARKRASKAQDLTDELTTYSRPDVTGMRKDKQASAIELATAGDRVKGAFGLQEQALKNAGGLAEAKVAHPDLGDAGGSGSDYITYVAQQIKNDPKNRLLFPKDVVAAATHQLAAGGGNIHNVTAQTQRMGEIANEIAPQVDELETMATDLQKQGIFNPLMGTPRKMLAEHGLGTLVGMSPEDAQKIAFFESKLGYFKSAIQNAHTGMRGAASAGVTEKFNKLMNDTGDLASFKGQLAAARDLLRVYGEAGSPDTLPKPGAQPPAGADPNAGFRVR